MKKALWGIVPVLILGVLFTLRLCNIINWSWWWVLTPLWVPLAIVLIVAVICFIVLVREVSKPHQTFNGIDFGE